MLDPLLPTVIQSLSVLSRLNRDPHLPLFTAELNHYANALRIKGGRVHFTDGDLLVLWARMLDLAQIEPLASDPEVPVDQDQIARDLDVPVPKLLRGAWPPKLKDQD